MKFLALLRLLFIVIACVGLIGVLTDVIALGLSEKVILPLDPLYMMILLVLGGELAFLANGRIDRMNRRHFIVKEF